MSLRILIAAGGTGGHIIPGLAVARALVETHQAEIRFVGTARGLESKLVPAAGFALDLIESGQLKNVSLATRLKTLVAVPKGILSCVRLLRRFRPAVILGIGGYSSGPAMIAALLTRTPAMVFEPNAVPGLANRLAGKWARAAAVNFPETAGYFRHAEVTGVPVREDFFYLPPLPADCPPHLLVFGGSQGARALNRTLAMISGRLLKAVPGLTILHQTGASHYEATAALYSRENAVRGKENGAAPERSIDEEMEPRIDVRPFLDNMPSHFARASLILCRSGASTVGELAAAGKPSLLVPFPAAADNHQQKNAEVLVRGGAAALLIESELTEETLLAALVDLLTDPTRLTGMGEAARAFARSHAAAHIGEIALRIARP